MFAQFACVDYQEKNRIKNRNWNKISIKKKKSSLPKTKDDIKRDLKFGQGMEEVTGRFLCMQKLLTYIRGGPWCERGHTHTVEIKHTRKVDLSVAYGEWRSHPQLAQLSCHMWIHAWHAHAHTDSQSCSQKHVRLSECACTEQGEAKRVRQPVKCLTGWIAPIMSSVHVWKCLRVRVSVCLAVVACCRSSKLCTGHWKVAALILQWSSHFLLNNWDKFSVCATWLLQPVQRRKQHISIILVYLTAFFFCLFFF